VNEIKDSLLYEGDNAVLSLKDIYDRVCISKYMLSMIEEICSNRDDRIKIETKGELSVKLVYFVLKGTLYSIEVINDLNLSIKDEREKAE
jgi:hypothetical protein